MDASKGVGDAGVRFNENSLSLFGNLAERRSCRNALPAQGRDTSHRLFGVSTGNRDWPWLTWYRTGMAERAI